MTLPVSLIWSGRHPDMFRFVVESWLRVGATIVVAADAQQSAFLSTLGVHHVPASTSPEQQGNARQASLDAIDALFPSTPVLSTDDDVVPLTKAWDFSGQPDGTIQAIRLVDVLGYRWYDWAVFRRGRAFMQALHEKQPGTYITGAAQVISPKVRRAISYKGLRYRVDIPDVRYCHLAVDAGFELLPPKPGPIAMHLDRLPASARVR